jgi:hypothetical protein
MSDDRCVRAGRAKTAYSSRAKARKAARLLRGGSQPEMTGKALWPYECPKCGAWHLSKMRRERS